MLFVFNSVHIFLVDINKPSNIERQMVAFMTSGMGEIEMEADAERVEELGYAALVELRKTHPEEIAWLLAGMQSFPNSSGLWRPSTTWSLRTTMTASELPSGWSGAGYAVGLLLKEAPPANVVALLKQRAELFAATYPGGDPPLRVMGFRLKLLRIVEEEQVLAS